MERESGLDSPDLEQNRSWPHLQSWCQSPTRSRETELGVGQTTVLCGRNRSGGRMNLGLYISREAEKEGRMGVHIQKPYIIEL